ncbi:hypothetical protein D3C71_906080 [compost metagenome]
MHVLCTDGATIGLFERFEQLSQLHRVFAAGKGADVKAFLEIRLGQIVVRRIEIRHTVLFPQSQRVEVRMLVTTEAISIDELQDFYLLHIGVRVRDRGRVT